MTATDLASLPPPPPPPSKPSDEVASGAGTRLPESGERGITTVAPRVVEKLAAAAAARVPGAHSASVSGLQAAVSHVVRSPGSVTAEVAGSTVRLQVHLEVEWPASIATVAGRTRDEIRATVLELAGLDLEVLDLSVEHLAHPRPRPRPRVL